MENLDFGKSANQIWRESGTSLTFKNWLQREKDKGRFLPNKKLMEFNDVDGESTTKARDLIQETLDKAEKKNKQVVKPIGISKAVVVTSALVVLGAIAFKIYQKKSK